MPTYSPHVLAQLTVKVPRGHQGFWNIIRDIGKGGAVFTLPDVYGRSNVCRDSVRDFLRRLVKAGYLEIVEPAVSGASPRAARYRLVKSQREAPKLRRDGSPAKDLGRGQEQMWRAMQMVKDFSPRDLVAASSTDEVAVTLETAKSYIKHLTAAGYLKRLGFDAYRLRPAMVAGPLAPQVYRTDFVFDPNSGEVRAPDGTVAIEVRP